MSLQSRSRRHLFKLALLLHAGPVFSWSFGMGATSLARLTIVDQEGQAIPYVTIWGALYPGPGALDLNTEDVWRLAQRYRDTFEFVTPFNNIVPTQWVPPMSDEKGFARIDIGYESHYGLGRKAPPGLRVGFVILKRGYLPAKIDLAVEGKSRLTARVVLERDPSQQVESAPYLLTYERVRYELSDTERFAAISEDTHVRIERLRSELESAAQQAVMLGDSVAAARIYARMQYLPAVKYFDGKPSGFSQSNPYAPAQYAYLRKAYALDPSHPYIAAKFTFREGSEMFGGNRYVPEAANAEQRAAFAAFLRRQQLLMQTSGEAIWPTYHELYALWHQQSSQPTERAYVLPLLETLYSREPKFRTREDLLRGM
jgi:hypothetical protein